MFGCTGSCFPSVYALVMGIGRTLLCSIYVDTTEKGVLCSLVYVANICTASVLCMEGYVDFWFMQMVFF